MADSARNAAKKNALTLAELRAGKAQRLRRSPGKAVDLTVVDKPTSKPRELTSVQIRAARLLAKGYDTSLVAKKLYASIVPDEPDRKTAFRKARTRVRNWCAAEAFRDAIWEYTMIEADLASPQIVRGVVGKAAAGRVDAARLALELNGRHSPFAEEKPAAINIVFAGIPRPEDEDRGIIEASIVEEDDGS